MDGRLQGVISVDHPECSPGSFVNVLFLFTLFQTWNVKTIPLKKEEFKMADNNDNKMSREEAGRKGGEATSKNHDKDFYRDIGEKGGRQRRSG